MLAFKIWFLPFVLALISIGTVAANVFEKSSELLDSLELSKIEPLSSEEAASVPKANWQPICQQVLINPAQLNPVVLPESDVVFVPQEIPGIVISPGRAETKSCIAPNGGGLTTFLREVYEILPHDRLNAIKNEAAQQAEVQKFANFIKSANFRNQSNALFKTNAFVVLRDYACQKLNLDIDELLQFVGIVLDVNAAPNASAATSTRDGLQGLLTEIKNILPFEEIKNLFKNKLAKDEYLREAMELLKSREFVAILKAVKDQPEYIALKNSLEENGLKLHGVVEYVRQTIDPQCNTKSCIAPNGGGLTKFLNEVYKILPHDRLNATKTEALKDPAVLNYANLFASETFKNHLEALFKTAAFVKYREFACQALFLDLHDLAKFEVAAFVVIVPALVKAARQEYAGMQDILKDIKEVIPLEDIKILYEKKLAEDEYLSKAMEAMNSIDCESISQAVKDQAEYETLIRDFEEYGFEFNEIFEFVGVQWFLMWNAD